MPTNTASTEACRIALAIVLIPLGAFVVQVFASSRLPPRKRQGDWLPTLAIFASLVLSSWLFAKMLLAPGGLAVERWYPEAGLGWLRVGAGDGSAPGGLLVHFGIQVDNLTCVMLFVVTLVSFVVHLYSSGYMHGEARYGRFFAYLALFSFSMLGLVVTSNLLFLFIFWELVGVTSYFLIGFYFEKPSAQAASMKAFITTRLGDLGFLLAILVIGSVAGSFEFDAIFQSVRDGLWDPALLSLTALCLFLGPVGKSAQFPLHIWLPDAMEGPTPVSALIHAATMVAAGVYLVGRMFPFMAGQPYFAGDFWQSDALLVVAVVGGFTAFFAATIAFVQTDIKKVLAYSTVSQLGYMMVGLGVGSVGAGLFHLTTHAFFKALLFLAAGSVIHAVHSNDLANMGGLRRRMPITWITTLVGTLALTGLPFLSGFYSKEGIIIEALAFAKHHGSFVSALPFVFAIATAGMTSFYMFRLFFSIFHGEPRDVESFRHAHESPWTMTVPLSVLAVLSIVAGGVLFPGGSSHWFEDRVNSFVLHAPGATGPWEAFRHLAHEGHVLVLILSIGLFVGGLALAALFYLPLGPFYRRTLARPGTLMGALQGFLEHLWYVDALLVGAARGLTRAATAACGAFDKYVVDGLVNFQGVLCRAVTALVGEVDYHGVDGAVRALGQATLSLGSRLRKVQTGFLQDYVYASIFLVAGLFAASLALLAFLGSVLR